MYLMILKNLPGILKVPVNEQLEFTGEFVG